MPPALTSADASRDSLIAHAVHQHDGHRASLADRFFARWFDRLVYTQIWEDPLQDMEALALNPRSRIVTIASAGCNALNYLSQGPASVLALDINHHHLALTRLKLAAVQGLQQPDFQRFFARGQEADARQLYTLGIRPHLDADTRAYWDAPVSGAPRIAMFERGFFREGLLGRFIGFLHWAARRCGIRLDGLFDCRSVQEQEAWFDREVAPLFARSWVRALCRSRSLLYSLGIPPRQYLALCNGDPGQMAAVLCERARRIAVTGPWWLNPFACQAYGRGYRQLPGECSDAGLPLYLQASQWDALRAHAPKARTQLGYFREVLLQREPGSLDGFVMLDAQDWMSPPELDALWREIERCGSPEARVVFRTAGAELPAPGLPAWVRERWSPAKDMASHWLAQDRSGIYGGFHAWRRG